MHTLHSQTAALTALTAAAAVSCIQPNICRMPHSSNQNYLQDMFYQPRQQAKEYLALLYNAGDAAVSRKRESHGGFVAWPVFLDCYFCGQL